MVPEEARITALCKFKSNVVVTLVTMLLKK